MYTRMNAVSLDLEFLGLTHRSARMHMLHRMAGTADITALRVLADVVEPVKDYNRWSDAKGPIDFHAPLTRMIDAAYPESDTARFFSNLVQTYISSGYKDQDAEKQIRMWLVLWSNNDSHLHRCWRHRRCCRKTKRSQPIFPESPRPACRPSTISTNLNPRPIPGRRSNSR